MYIYIYVYIYANHSRYLADRHSVISTANLFNVTLIYWPNKKKSDTSISSYNAETIAI